MPFAATPATAAWSHRDARSGFDVVCFQWLDVGCHIDGCTTAVENGQTWFVEYGITLDADCRRTGGLRPRCRPVRRTTGTGWRRGRRLPGLPHRRRDVAIRC